MYYLYKLNAALINGIQLIWYLKQLYDGSIAEKSKTLYFCRRNIIYNGQYVYVSETNNSSFMDENDTCADLQGVGGDGPPPSGEVKFITFT